MLPPYSWTFSEIGGILTITKISLTLHDETRQALDQSLPNSNKVLFLCTQATFFGLLYLSRIYVYLTFPLHGLGILGFATIVVTILGCIVCFATAAMSGRWLSHSWASPGEERTGLLNPGP
ncbi:hypothetical protein BDQ17DRAFT_1360391 [Cyathus striatus]|nr:hypothetical protein BDQ17DRAFT_1360391 [Cyathus striatus]